MKIRIYVTQEDIRKGRRHSSYACPLAKAIKRTLGWKSAWVGIQWWGRGKTEYGNTSKVMAAALERFDYDEGLQPFSFCIFHPAAWTVVKKKPKYKLYKKLLDKQTYKII